MSRVGLFPSKNISSFSSCGTCVIALRFSKAGAGEPSSSLLHLFSSSSSTSHQT
ncbi:hypothetical protein FOMG_16626 [Fusarium oxysporum f. sp. melonis 26406]|uniref:Uncharacterized protein n=1 Tax=Fusarium oxysporum f. sp. melonis 26406 TaxID=1089452 RepID=W9ZEV5_FUSOX|nr:hypothetical protein FOMG_16626 [Fusarium oxysporum f. sp. melonis 26406]